MRPHTESLGCRFEKLEPRTLLSGDVFAGVTKHGNLRIIGDRADNHIVVESFNEGIRVSGLDGTTINGTDSVDLFGHTKKTVIKLKRGDDTVDLVGADLPGNLKMRLGRGDDIAHLFDVNIDGNFNAKGKKGADILTRDNSDIEGKVKIKKFEVDQVDLAGANALFAGATGTAGQVSQENNVMMIKLDQAIDTLTDRKANDQQHMQAINQLMESVFTSNIFILPTFDGQGQQTDPESAALFEESMGLMQEAIDGLNKHVNGPKKIGSGETKAAAAEARNFLLIFEEAAQVIAEQTAQVDPQDADQHPLLGADSEEGNLVDSVLDGIFQRGIRSPFPSFLFPNIGAPQEQVIPFVLEPGETGVIVKEIQGIKAVLSAREVPIWVEPWFARAQIVGFRTVYVWEFVPAEFIKTLTFHHDAETNEIITDSQIDIILERELLHFWQFAHKDVQVTGSIQSNHSSGAAA